MIGLESCSKKPEVPASQSTDSPVGDGRSVAKGLTELVARGGHEAINRAHPAPEGTSIAIAVEV